MSSAKNPRDLSNTPVRQLTVGDAMAIPIYELIPEIGTQPTTARY